MKFGLVLPYNQTQNIPELSKLMEGSGWDGCFLSDAIWCEDPMIGLAAAAVVTSHINLGTIIIPVPIRRPWKLASESLAIDRLSRGRMILGLGTGAVWMGWHSFPTEVTDNKARAEMLEETIEILTLMFQSKQFDYDGQHYQVRLTLTGEEHFPPRSIQQPRIPIWIPAIWPKKKSMQRVLKSDGMIPEKYGPDGQPLAVTPAEIREIKEYVDASRKQKTPFDIVINGNTKGLDKKQKQDKIRPFLEAGATWWIEELGNESADAVSDRICQGPPLIQ